jgi:hypothetical protein
MNKIYIDPHNCSREEHKELIQYLESKCWDYKIIGTPIKHFIANEESYNKLYEIQYILDDDKINNIQIAEKIREEDLFEYCIINRESFIEELIGWISEATKDKHLMISDLKLLMNISDEYIFSSISTNHYIYKGCSNFNSTCKELLELNNTLLKNG